MVFPILVANVLTYEPANQVRWLICMAAIAIFSALTMYLPHGHHDPDDL